MPVLLLDQEECWVLHEWVRRERSAPVYGEEHDLAFVQKLWRAILTLSSSGNEGGTTEVEFTPIELLQITRQVSTMIAMGARPIGKELLKKSFTALLLDDNVEMGDVPIPDVFRNAYTNDAGNFPGGGTDAEALTG